MLCPSTERQIAMNRYLPGRSLSINPRLPELSKSFMPPIPVRQPQSIAVVA